MYPSVVLSDTLRRNLSADDAQGVCDIYPHQHDVCPAPPSDGGCSVVVGGNRDLAQTTMLLAAAASVLAGLFFLRRRLKI